MGHFEWINGDVLYFPGFIPSENAHQLMKTMQATLRWEQEEVKLFGKKHLVPRLIAWYGEEGTQYRYAGTDHVALHWTPELYEIMQLVTAKCHTSFNSVLLNRYRNGKDSMGWHSVIASVSLGTTRRFDLGLKSDPTQKLKIPLEHGSLLVMKGFVQHDWQHQIPKQLRITEERLNLTFRQVKN